MRACLRLLQSLSRLPLSDRAHPRVQNRSAYLPVKLKVCTIGIRESKAMFGAPQAIATMAESRAL